MRAVTRFERDLLRREQLHAAACALCDRDLVYAPAPAPLGRNVPPKDLVRLVVPRSVEHETIYGCVPRWSEGRAHVELPRRHAAYLLATSPNWRVDNYELAPELAGDLA